MIPPLAYFLSDEHENLEGLIAAAFVMGMGWLAAFLWRRGRRVGAFACLASATVLATVGSGNPGVGIAALAFASVTACIGAWWMRLG